MGGAIPLPPQIGPAHPAPYPQSPHCLWVNSGRAALECILRSMPQRPQRVWLPRFICDTVAEPLQRLGIPIARYAVDAQLQPILPADVTAQDAFVAVNYFGLTPQAVATAAAVLPCPVIADATTAFYYTPPQGVAAFYSPRKFTGMADGGIACAPWPLPRTLPQDTDSTRRTQQLQTHYTPQHVQAAEDALSHTPPMRLGSLSCELMLATNWPQAAARRIRNYTLLHRALGGINRLQLPAQAPAAPMCYPLVCGIPGLRDSLIDAGIRLPLYWPEVIEATAAHEQENALARNLLPLPLDQRYTADNMHWLLQHIL